MQVWQHDVVAVKLGELQDVLDGCCVHADGFGQFLNWLVEVQGCFEQSNLQSGNDFSGARVLCGCLVDATSREDAQNVVDPEYYQIDENVSIMTGWCSDELQSVLLQYFVPFLLEAFQHQYYVGFRWVVAWQNSKFGQN